jgi:hypothetical protein
MLKFKSVFALGVAAAMIMAFSSNGFASTWNGGPTTLSVSACCGSGPFGTVSGSGTGTVLVTVDLAGGFQFISGGQAGIFAFNTNEAVTITNITLAGGNSSFTPTTGSAGGGTTFVEHMDGGGFFTAAITSTGNGGSNPLGNVLTFDVTGTGLTVANFITNAGSNLFAADISTGCTPAAGGSTVTCNGSTGIVTNGGGSVVPLPATLPLLGSGLGAMWLFGRRKRKSAPAMAAA